MQNNLYSYLYTKKLLMVTSKNSSITFFVCVLMFAIWAPSCFAEDWDLENNHNFDSMTDLRDGLVYKTVQIGSQTWMAENLSFNTDDSYCNGDKAIHCIRYGRLYTWKAAMNACPAGWRLPTEADWTYLLDIVGGQPLAGKMLKSVSSWQKPNRGTNVFGFSANPAGVRFEDGTYNDPGRYAIFWSASEESEKEAYGLYLQNFNDRADLNSSDKKNGFSVRCVKGNIRRETRDERREGNAVVGNLLTDSRDGQTYRTVQIGSQTWMAENLNLKTDSSFCYNEADSNCTKYGQLYKLIDVMDSAGRFSSNGKGCGYREKCTPRYPVRGVCPLGWHVPTKSEWEVLFVAVGGILDKRGDYAMAGKFLKAKNGWIQSSKRIDEIDVVDRKGYWEKKKLDNPVSVTGTDDYGFSVLPAGMWRTWRGFQLEGENVTFWAAKEPTSYENVVKFRFDDAGAYFSKANLYDGFYVRCIKD